MKKFKVEDVINILKEHGKTEYLRQLARAFDHSKSFREHLEFVDMMGGLHDPCNVMDHYSVSPVIYDFLRELKIPTTRSGYVYY